MGQSIRWLSLWAFVSSICMGTVTRAPAQIAETRVRLLTQNALGTNDANCELRAQTIGNNIAAADPPYDIVAMQEYFATSDFGLFSCDSEHLLEAIRSTGLYATSGHTLLHKPEGEVLELEADGGIGVFHRLPFGLWHQQEWSQNQSFIHGAVHGFTYTSVTHPNATLGYNIVDVHFLSNGDGCDQACRRGAMEELRAFLLLFGPRSQYPIFVMGDFNIGGPPTFNGNAGYQDILDVLGNPRDLWFEAHPTEGGYTFDSQDNSLAAADCGEPCQERIDYIFLITDPLLTSNVYEVEVDSADVKLVKWTTGGAENLPVADHWGVEATVTIRGESAIWVDFDHTGAESGLPHQPFNTLGEAIVAAPPGGRIMIRAGNTATTPMISSAVVLDAFAGSVIIGQ